MKPEAKHGLFPALSDGYLRYANVTQLFWKGLWCLTVLVGWMVSVVGRGMGTLCRWDLGHVFGDEVGLRREDGWFNLMGVYRDLGDAHKCYTGEY